MRWSSVYAIRVVAVVSLVVILALVAVRGAVGPGGSRDPGKPRLGVTISKETTRIVEPLDEDGLNWDDIVIRTDRQKE